MRCTRETLTIRDEDGEQTGQASDGEEGQLRYLPGAV